MHAELRCAYRLQLSSTFTLDDAAGIVDYLAELGVSHIYLSPILQATPGSEHGYDVTDPTFVSTDLGGEDALGRLFQRLKDHGMGAILDIVPNHLAATQENPWWWDVLKNGQDSDYAEFFDITWDAADPELKGKILLPVLGKHLGEVLAGDEITIHICDDEPVISYMNLRFPLNEKGKDFIRQSGWKIEQLLDRQHYRLAYWRTGADEINYRRFFDITSLVGLRVEDSAVFEATHAKLLSIIRSGPVDGIRVDHPDGLRDPTGYLTRLRDAVGDRWLVVEKILETDEKLSTHWPVHGTTGYDFLQRVGGLFIDPNGEKAITDFYTGFTGRAEPYGSLVRDNKRRVLLQSFDADLRHLVELLKRICGHSTLKLDYSRRILHEALSEIIVSFPTYRSYVHHARGELTHSDREAIRQAVESTRRRVPGLEDELLSLIEETLRGEIPPNNLTEEFTAKFQQLSGPIMAKGVEDTTFYYYDRMLALNEVGCDPARFGVSTQSFHEACSVAHSEWPSSMLSTSTHDTKRSEDVRARLSLLSEVPDQWAEQVRIWSSHNLPAWQGREPDRSAEHLLYQTMVGAWPISCDRLEPYMRKACREAKNHTSWTEPNEAYEERILEFTRTVSNDPDFIAMLEDFIRPLMPLGRINSLSQLLLKLTAPGIPDLYQGCELWCDSLVDPDNRRAIDYEIRKKLLTEVRAALQMDSLMTRPDEGVSKLHVIHRSLELRSLHPASFAPGDFGSYRPMLVAGEKLKHIVAYTRGQRIAVVVPRLVHGIGNDWANTTVELGNGLWRNVLDESQHQGRVPASTLFDRFPVALLSLSK